MNNKKNILPLPSGWFAVAFSKELKKGKILPCTFMDQEIILFRTHEGVSSALDAHCPHLGAHLGHGGKVVDGCVQCPFHHLKFGTDGQCTKAKQIKAKTWPLKEQNGLIFLYHGNSEKNHELPNLIKEGYKLHKTAILKFKGHPQEVVENVFDPNHFGPVHNFPPPELHELSLNTDILTGIYKTEKTLESISTTPYAISFAIFALGLVLTKYQFPWLKLEVASLTAPCPTNDNHTELRLLYFTKTSGPLSLFHKLILIPFMYITCKIAYRVMSEDAAIWHHRKYLPNPSLQHNDGPIPAFRKWARRFYD